MQFNWFLLCAGLLYIGGAVQAGTQLDFRYAGICLCYAVANFLFMTMQR